MTRFISLLAVASLTLAACAYSGTTKSSTGKSSTGNTSSLPAYELIKDDRALAANEAHWRLALDRCGVQEKNIRPDCVVDLIARSLPDTDLVAQYCKDKGDFVDESDCLTMASYAVDLARRAGNPTITEFLSNLPSEYSEASGDAAVLLAESIWQECPDGPGAVACRIEEAAARLETTPADRTRCEALPEDRKIVSCLMIARFAHRMNAGTEKMKEL